MVDPEIVFSAFGNLLNLEPEQIVGKSDYDLFPKDSIDVIRPNDERVLIHGEIILIHHHGVPNMRFCICSIE